jgi:cytochrome c-type protein NapB
MIAFAMVLTAVQSKDASIADRELGLCKSSVFETVAPPVTSPNVSEPGDEPVLPRVYDGAPPLIPHGISEFTPIVRDENMCLDCHLIEEKIEGEPTPIPESHFRDLRNAPGVVRDEIAGARFVCTTCHVPLTDAEPPVGNGF